MSQPNSRSVAPFRAVRPNTPVSYAIAAAALAGAILVRYVFDPWMGDTLPLVTLFGAVAAAAWVGGMRAAALVTVLGYIVCAYLFIEPRGTVTFPNPGTLIGLLAYLFTCALIIGFSEMTRSAQRRASEQSELLRVTLHSIGDAVITTDVAGRVTYMNAVAEDLTGWTQAEAVAHPLDDVFRIVNEDTRQPVENPATKALREGVVVGLANHTVLIRKDGGDSPIDDSAAPIRDELGRLSGCVLIFRDVSAQRRLQRDRAGQLLTARLLASIVESSDDAILSKSLDGTIQSWNRGAERLFGYSAAEAIGRHISLVIPPERIAEEDDIVANLKAGRRIDHFETERVRADGSRLLVSLTISPIKDDDGTVIGASKIVRDVTRQREAEQRERRLLSETAAVNAKFQALVDQSTDFIGICDLNGVSIFINRAGLALVGLADLDEARHAPVKDFFFPEDQPRIVDEFLPSVLARGHGEVDVRFRNFKTGEARWMAYKVVTLPGADGQPMGFATVSQDMTERRQLEDNLRSLAADLSEADRRKNEFLAILAHELRNPLAPISNAARVLRLGGPADGIKSAAEVLERQVAQMSRLVDDLLDMSRISRGKIDLRKQRVELRPIVEQAVESVRPIAESNGQELTVTLPSGVIVLDADPARLAQVIGNLLSNACKFTDRGGQIRLTVAEEDGAAVIRVTDNGIGIAAENLPRLFEMFAQVDTSLERSRDGLGIGLTLVKTLVELHGGTVAVQSAGLGRGTEFIVRLPVAADRLASALPAAPSEKAPRRRRILIVDDSQDGAESLAMLLQIGGHETHVVHDGAEALVAAERIRPDLILLDIGLPKLNGYEVCSRIRERPWGREVRLVALTGWGQEQDRHRSKAAGFDVHLVKPVDHDVLLKMMAE